MAGWLALASYVIHMAVGKQERLGQLISSSIRAPTSHLAQPCVRCFPWFALLRQGSAEALYMKSSMPRKKQPMHCFFDTENDLGREKIATTAEHTER